MQKDLLHACNSVLAAIEKKYYVPELLKDFLKNETETNLSRVYVVQVLPRKVVEINDKSADLVFPILAAFMDR